MWQICHVPQKSSHILIVEPFPLCTLQVSPDELCEPGPWNMAQVLIKTLTIRSSWIAHVLLFFPGLQPSRLNRQKCGNVGLSSLNWTGNHTQKDREINEAKCENCKFSKRFTGWWDMRSWFDWKFSLGRKQKSGKKVAQFLRTSNLRSWKFF